MTLPEFWSPLEAAGNLCSLNPERNMDRGREKGIELFEYIIACAIEKRELVKYEGSLKVASCIRWAIRKGFDVSDEYRELVDSLPPDWDYWNSRDHWSLGQLANILEGKEPLPLGLNSLKSWSPEQLASFPKVNDSLPLSLDNFNSLISWHLAQLAIPMEGNEPPNEIEVCESIHDARLPSDIVAALDVGTLEYEDYEQTKRIKPRDFVNWAKERDFPFPEEMLEIIRPESETEVVRASEEIRKRIISGGKSIAAGKKGGSSPKTKKADPKVYVPIYRKALEREKARGGSKSPTQIAKEVAKTFDISGKTVVRNNRNLPQDK